MHKLAFIIVVIIHIGCSQKKNQETVSEETTTVSEEKPAEELISAKDSLFVESLIQDLQGIEKHAVEGNFYRMMALLIFNGDNNSNKVNALLKKVSWNPSYKAMVFGVVDKKNGYAQFSASHPSIQAQGSLTIVYWNLSDGTQLVAYASTDCDMFCEAEISFKNYKNGVYESIENQEIIPDINKLNKILLPVRDGGVDFKFILPQNGKNIQYCANDNCIELLWKDGIFLPGELSKLGSGEDFDISIATPNHFEGGLNHFLLKGDVLPDEDLATINAWTSGQVINSSELAILYGTDWAETIKEWYGLHETRPESMEIVEKKEVGDIAYLTYQFNQEEEDYRGNIVCVRSLEAGEWKSEISFKDVKDVRMGAAGNSFSYSGQIDYTTDPKKLILEKSVNSLLFQYLDVDYSTVDLPMTHERVTTYDFEITDNTLLRIQANGKTEQNNFPLTKDGIERVKKDNSIQYYIDQTNKLDESYEKQKKEIIAYLNRVQNELIKK